MIRKNVSRLCNILFVLALCATCCFAEHMGPIIKLDAEAAGRGAGPHFIDLAFGTDGDQALAAWSFSDGESLKVRTQLLNLDSAGAVLSTFPGIEPQVVYVEHRDEFLLTHGFGTATPTEAQVFSYGGPVGSSFHVQAAHQEPRLIYDPRTMDVLHAARTFGAGEPNNQIKSQRIGPTYGLEQLQRVDTGSPAFSSAPFGDLAVNDDLTFYLWRNQTIPFVLSGRIDGPNGLEPTIEIAESDDDAFRNMTVAPLHDGFVTAYEFGDRIEAKVIGADGSLGDPVVLNHSPVETTGSQSFKLTCYPDNSSCLLISRRGDERLLYGEFFDAELESLGGEFLVLTSEERISSVDVVYNPNAEGFLVGWTADGSAGARMVYGVPEPDASALLLSALFLSLPLRRRR